MSQTVFRTGNSLAVTVPSDFVKSLGIRPGDLVKVNCEGDKGKLTFLFSGAKQLPLSETFLKRKKK
ncbi:hypothetical protein CO053_01655 [Candidatus Shapirobacteria bacterium CG_4_9_14_0_2_um_filter_40_11]|uniref:SpoVT-AbrB domain-containing protein n=1 Tax=Candidatus Shapirobacteria bacterium CG_4_9_14_0_2_um_filter_40_11 TaxID=1974876 RepID=A0A2M8EV41_9BACT|nr:MAG: hypothetical protein CO053_01655 [Candidatus Shapirobacteria bacterium CG_4_9_14_0_2_um_filter_40_11]